MKSGFEKWLKTAGGKKALDLKTLTNQQLLYNRLWWAYYAGNMSKQVWATTEVQQVLEEISKRKLPVGLKRKIDYILNNKGDYSIEKL